MSLEFWLLYAVTVFLASISPGPSMLLALTHGMKYGARRTMATAAGNVAASLLQAAASIAGLGAILTLSDNVFSIVRWLGAGYLIYLGIVTWRSSSLMETREKDDAPGSGLTLRAMFLRSFLVAAGNPKAIIFFTALFPQIVGSGVRRLSEVSILLGTLALIAFLCFMLYATAGQRILALFSRQASGRNLNRIAGGAFIGAGIGLAVNRR
jgi:homoserine/homoserine lactone efflux protein